MELIKIIILENEKKTHYYNVLIVIIYTLKLISRCVISKLQCKKYKRYKLQKKITQEVVVTLLYKSNIR